MKTPLLLSVLMLGLILGVYGQKPTITLTFTADENGQHVPLNSILIENLTREVDTTLYAPDTVLVIDYLVGIHENLSYGGDGFYLSQNYPNPFDGETTIDVLLPETENVLIIVSDMLGRELLNKKFRLNHGKHSFSFYPGTESLYFLTARTDRHSQTIKMINTPAQSSSPKNCALEYKGMTFGFEQYKSGNDETGFVFYLGDLLKFTAFTDIGERCISSSPAGDKMYQFNFTGTPCPGIPTVTDIDGNVYNTVLIGEQCWIKENLKTTHYRNGTPIEYPGDNNILWQINTTGAYAWYNNNLNWKDSYGALYNWHAANNAHGLCPTGWHVPSDDEWSQMVDFMVARGFPNSNVPHGAGNALKSCRQVNSPQGGCNTIEHPRWAQNPTLGFNQYGFSGLPAGDRGWNGEYSAMGGHTAWFSSTENSSQQVWGYSLFYSQGFITRGSGLKSTGISVRCMRNDLAVKRVQLNLTTDPLGAGIVIGAGEYKPGEEIEVSTIPHSTWNFINWTDDNGIVSGVPNFVYTMPAHDITLTANYVEEQGGFICGDSTMMDIDGNVYSTVLIGAQCWMGENLKTTRDAAGNNITRSCYNNDANYCNWYGGLYNWHTIMNGASSSNNNPSGVQGICPVGWHVPSDAEITQLMDFLGGESVAGGKLKSTRTIPDPHPRWSGPNTGATNESNWSGLPGGLRTDNNYLDITAAGFWLSSTQSSSSWARLFYLTYNQSHATRFQNDKLFSFSLRCLKD